MDKSDYQYLRFAIEASVNELRTSCHVSDAAFVSDLMRIFIASAATSRVRASRLKREFVTFRRSQTVKPPSWALRKPGIDSRLPTL